MVAPVEGIHHSAEVSLSHVLPQKLWLRQMLQAAGIFTDLEFDASQSPLPEDCQFERPSLIGRLEVAKLLQRVEMGKKTPANYIDQRHLKACCALVRIMDVGVRSVGDDLIGFGSVIYRGENGKMIDFVVSPEHQHRGVGMAILKEQLLGRQAITRRLVVAGSGVPRTLGR